MRPKECPCAISVLAYTLVLLLSTTLVTGCRNAEAAKAEHVTRGEGFLTARKYQEASIEFRNAIQIDAKLGSAHWGLARAYEGLQRFPEAFEELRKAVDFDANNNEARVKLGNYFLMSRPPQIGEAERLAKEALAKNANDIEGTILSGNVLFLQGNKDGAFAQLNHAIQLNTERVESYLSLARFYISSNDSNKAEETFRRAIQLNEKSAVAHSEYGKFLVSANRKDQAEAEMSRAVEVEPTNRDVRFVLASFFLVNGRLDKAEESYKALAELDRDRPEGRSVLADFYSAVGRYPESISIYKEIATRTPDYSRARYRLGELMMQNGDLTGAAGQADEALKMNPRDMQALTLRARVKLSAGQVNDLKAAVEDLREVLRQEPNSRQGLYFMADANFREGQLDQATAYAGDLERFYPDYLPAKLMLTQLYLASGDSKAAVRAAGNLLDRLGKTVPDAENPPQLLSELRAKTLTTRGLAYLSIKDLKSARADFQTAKDMAPGSTATYVNLATVSVKEGNLSEAKELYEQALRLNGSDFDALSGLIRDVYMAARQFGEAHQRLDQVLGSQPDSAPLHFLNSQVFQSEGNTQQEEAELQRAVELDPGYVPAFSSLAALHVKNRRPDQALAEYRKILERGETAVTYTLIAMVEESRGNLDAAVQGYRKALELDPNAPVPANNLAWLIAERGVGNLDEAVRLSQGAVQRYPNTPGFADTLGWVYQKKGLYGAAAEQLQKAVAGELDNATYRYHLGIAYASKGDRAEARLQLEQALKQMNRLASDDAADARNTLSSL
jgi:tetratricopeptide (TPR) repeat protein